MRREPAQNRCVRFTDTLWNALGLGGAAVGWDRSDIIREGAKDKLESLKEEKRNGGKVETNKRTGTAPSTVRERK